MKPILISLLWILCCPLLVFAQEPATEVKYPVFSDLYIQVLASRTGHAIEPENFNHLVSESSLFQEFLTEHSNYRDNTEHTTRLSGFMVSAGIDLKNRKNIGWLAKRQLRLGIGYYSSNNLNSSYQHNPERVPVDTLVFPMSQPNVYVESERLGYYHLMHQSQQLRVDAALLFRTKPLSRWTFFGGAGMALGVAFNSRASVVYMGADFLYTDAGYGESTSGYHYRDSDHQKVNGHLGFSWYLPLGIDVNMAKSHVIWSRVRAFYEIRPTVNLIPVPDLKTYFNARLNHGFGLRINLTDNQNK